MPVSYVFDSLLIHLCEYNILPGLLMAPKRSIGNKDFQFLTSKSLYNAFQERQGSITTPSLICQSFPPNYRKKSSFWDRYGGPDSPRPASCWDLQIPLYIRLKRQELEILAIPEEDRSKAKVDAYLWLNALGWFTHIEIRLFFPLKASQVADLCDNLRDKAYGPPAYRLNGVDMKLKELLVHFRETLFSEILSSNLEYTRPDHIPNLLFVDVLRASGEPTCFPDIPNAYIQQLARIIKRNNVRVFFQNEGQAIFPIIARMLVTKIDPDFYNFSLTDFDMGSFTFLQKEALKKGGSTRPFCFAQNTRDCFLLSYFWLEACRVLKDAAASKAAISRLLNNGVSVLRHVSDNYSSRTALRLLQKHKGLLALLEGNEEEEEPQSEDLDGYAIPT